MQKEIIKNIFDHIEGYISEEGSGVDEKTVKAFKERRPVAEFIVNALVAKTLAPKPKVKDVDVETAIKYISEIRTGTQCTTIEAISLYKAILG